MKTFLIIGVDSVVGANLAASWSEQTRVIGLSSGAPVSISGCERATVERSSLDGFRKCLQQTRATHVIFCGSAAKSSWESPAKSGDDANAELWAIATAELGLHFTLISSDAVFSGPWMFHNETSQTICRSAEAKAIREIEARVQAACPNSLIVRTNAFGWSPSGSKNGWLESLISALENNKAIELDPICHSTPILASDLADYLEPVLEDELAGVFHIAGAERVSPHGFARQLAATLELAAPTQRTIRELESRPSGFGRGETSLQTKRFRSEYECSMPMLSDGLQRLVQQQQSGYRDRLAGKAIRTGKAA